MSCSTCGNITPLVFNVQSFLNTNCSNCNDSQCYPAAKVCYTGPALPCSGIETNEDLDSALTKIDEILCTNSGDYSTYQMGCIPAAYGEAITTEAQFVEAISDYVCSINTTSETFITNTFPTYQTTINNRFEVIETPAVACTSAGILVGDTLTDVYTKYCAKFTSIDDALDMTDVDFATCFVVATAPTTVKEGFEEILNQLCQVKTLAEEASDGTNLPTFNNVGSCLAGTLTTTDTLEDTVTKIRTKLCTLPTWDDSALTWGCVGAPSTSDLEAGVQKILTKVNYMLPKVVTFGTGFSVAQTGVDPCDGVTVTLDAITDRFVAANPTDATPATLEDKLVGEGITIDSLVNPDQITLISDYKVKAETSDDSPSFLINKLNGSTSNGITINPVYNSTTKKIDLNLSVNISELCALLASCSSTVPCTGYTVTPDGTSSLSYTDCDGAVVSITVSGPTDICARLNTVYAPNATIVNTGACSPADSPIFTLINNSTDVVVTNILTGGLPFYTVSTGSFPVNPTEFLSGIGNTSGIVSVLTSAGNGTANLYKNDVLVDTVALVGGGTFDFSAIAYAAGDDLKVIVTPYSMFSITNAVADASDATITDVTTSTGSYFYILDGGSSFPFTGLTVGSGTGTTSSPVRVTITYTGGTTKYLSLLKNGSVQEVIPVATGGVFDFAAVSFAPGDFMAIRLEDTDPTA